MLARWYGLRFGYILLCTFQVNGNIYFKMRIHILRACKLPARQIKHQCRLQIYTRTHTHAHLHFCQHCNEHSSQRDANTSQLQCTEYMVWCASRLWVSSTEQSGKHCMHLHFRKFSEKRTHSYRLNENIQTMYAFYARNWWFNMRVKKNAENCWKIAWSVRIQMCMNKWHILLCSRNIAKCVTFVCHPPKC